MYILTSRRWLASALRLADSDSALAAAERAVACSTFKIGSQHTTYGCVYTYIWIYI